MSRAALAALLVSKFAFHASAGNFSLAGPGGAIPDHQPGTGSWNSSYSGVPFSSTVHVASDVTSLTAVHLFGFQHTWRGDLHILLKDPVGALHNLVVRPGSDGWTPGDTGNYLVGDYRFVDAGGASVQQGTSNIGPGDYVLHHNAGPGMWTVGASNGPLAAITGPAGAWTLEIRDWAGSDIGALTGWRLEGTDASVPIVSFCAGDGTASDHTTACPCGNTGAFGRGCANSSNASGALLGATGAPWLDTAVLHASGMPSTAVAIYLQGTATTDVVFGDGVRCTGGTLVRLRMRASINGASSFPNGLDTVTLADRGYVVPGSGVFRWYQAYYRNSTSTFCPPATFNVTNGLRIAW